MGTHGLDFLKSVQDTKIPLPSTSHLTKAYKDKGVVHTENQEETKYKKEYDAYCRWFALPKDQRNPKTLQAFEIKWKIPKNYTAFFRQRADFFERAMKYFYEWVFDLWPDVVQAQYRLVMKNGNPQAAKFFSEIIAKNIDMDKPQAVIKPIVMVGVAQEDIDKLFVPKPLREVEDAVIVER